MDRPEGAAARSTVVAEGKARWLLAVTLLGYTVWYVVFLTIGPKLPLNHDELNFVQEALKLLGQHRYDGYFHGPLLYELVAVVEATWYLFLKLVGQVHSPAEFLTYAIAHQDNLLRAGRLITGLASLLFLVQVYRVGRLFGGRWVGALASFLCALNLTFICISSVLKEDPLLWLFLLVACFEAWRATEERRTISAVFAGLAMGAAVVTKYTGLVAFTLAALPLLRSSRDGRNRALVLGAVMAATGIVTTFVLFPWLITDTADVVRSFRGLNSLYNGLGSNGLALKSYLYPHLRNLAGWIVPAMAIIEGARLVLRDRRGVILLCAVPFALLLILGARPGFSQASYLFPAVPFLCILASALCIRSARSARSNVLRLAPLVALTCVALFDHAFLRGALKHMAFLIRPYDTRLLARDYIYQHASPGDGILITEGLVGHNFFGPPLLPRELPPTTGAFKVAEREVLRLASGPRYDVYVENGHGFGVRPSISPELASRSEWIIVPQFAWSPEMGAPPGTPEPGDDFRAAAVMDASLEARTGLYPYYLAADYDRLRRTALSMILHSDETGWTLRIYRRSHPGTQGTQSPVR